MITDKPCSLAFFMYGNIPKKRCLSNDLYDERIQHFENTLYINIKGCSFDMNIGCITNNDRMTTFLSDCLNCLPFRRNILCETGLRSYEI